MKKKKKEICLNCVGYPITECCDCGAKTVYLTYDEAQDCLSALSYFRDFYPKKAPETLKAMAKIEKKLWELKS